MLPSFKVWSDKFSLMRRRTFAKTVGAGIAGLGLSSTVSARGEGELPNENVDFTRVHPFGSKKNPIAVPTGSWIKHYTGWVDDGEQHKEEVEAYLDAVELSAYIDGEEVEKPEQYWGDIWLQDRSDEGEEPVYKWVVYWEYDTPPKEPGMHTFRTEYHYPDGLDAGASQRPVGHTDTLTSYYEVLPREE